jgi:hypothetical protein
MNPRVDRVSTVVRERLSITRDQAIDLEQDKILAETLRFSAP